MNRQLAILKRAALSSVVALALSSHLCAAVKEVPAGLAEFEGIKDEALPAVAAMTGLSSSDPMKVDMMTRSEVADFVRRTVALEYPGDELDKRSRCLAEIGLLPGGYDLTEGMVDLIGEQAGAIYDPHTKTLLGISDLPVQLQAHTTQKLIVSHEVCHALQDLVIDIVARSRETVNDIDGEYALRSVIEGMATVVMLAYCQDLPIERVPDARATMRSGFSQNQKNPGMRALAASPVYLQESLISPYAEGGSFAQAWLRANPGVKIGAMLAKMPTTSEQVLHFDKYVEPDLPTAIDLSPVSSALPEGWAFFYTNTLGEFDLRVLFGLQDETRAVADQAAAGWDGLRFEAYTDSLGRLVVAGSSVWDSQTDAEEFSAALQKVLAAGGDAEYGMVAQTGTTVCFAVGPAEREINVRLVEALSKTGPGN